MFLFVSDRKSLQRQMRKPILQVAIDRFQREKNDPSVIVFREIKRYQLPHSTQFFQKAVLAFAQPEFQVADRMNHRVVSS